MISLELSTIQHKDAERTWLSQAMAEFEQRGGATAVLPSTARSGEWDTEFNSRTKTGRTVRIRADRDAKVIEAAKTMTVGRAEKVLGIHHSTLTSMATRLGIEFQKAYAVSTAYKAQDPVLVERIVAMRDVGLNRAQVMKHVGVGYDKFHRLMNEYQIDFPTVPRRYRNGLAKS